MPKLNKSDRTTLRDILMRIEAAEMAIREPDKQITPDFALSMTAQAGELLGHYLATH